MSRRREPPRRGVDLWLCDPDALAAPERRPALLALLDPEERARYERFRVERGRRLFLAGRLLVRGVLSRYAEVDPRAWRFRFGAHGRPEILQPASAAALRFNLSHTDGLVACGVTLEADLGIDVEEIGRARKLRRLADHTFAPSEAADVRAAAAADRRRRFFAYWTLKEAYVKARGEGMTLPLDRFAFSFPGAGTIDARFDAEVDADGGAWGFALFEATPRHLLAVARRPAGAPEAIARAWRVRPPRSGEPSGEPAEALTGALRVTLRRLAASG